MNQQYCHKCHQPIQQTLELIFRYGYEGGGTEVFRDDKGSIHLFSSRGGMLDEDEDPYVRTHTIYRIWSSYFSEFQFKNRDWIRLQPSFIHDDIRDSIDTALNTEKPSWREEYNIEAKATWKRFLDQESKV